MNYNQIQHKYKIVSQDSLEDNLSKKYVCVANQSASKFKNWDNREGWQKTFDYLKSLGYGVVCLDGSSSSSFEGQSNEILKNCIYKINNLPLNDKINSINNCDFFIGSNYELSWLARSLGKPVIFISEFPLSGEALETPYKIINSQENFDHSNKITFEMVKDKIDLLMVKESFDWDFSLIKFKVSFINSAKIDILDNKYQRYLINLYHFYNGEWVLYHDFVDLDPFAYYKGVCTKRLKWRWKVYAFEGDNVKLVLQYTYNEKGKNVEFKFDSESSKIDKCYLEKAIKFEKDNDCKVFVRSKYHEKLKKAFPDFARIYNLKEPMPEEMYACYDIKRNEIETKRYNFCYSQKFWQKHGKSEITYDHTENWLEYKQEDVFEDIINYEQNNINLGN